MEWYLAAFRKYVEFSGRARRKEYWMFTLFNSLIFMVPYFAIMFLSLQGSGSSSMLGVVLMGALALYWLGTFLPTLAVTVRRLHDTGRSGWWILVNFVPLLGAIAFLFFLCSDGTPGTNQYGANPKESAAW